MNTLKSSLLIFCTMMVLSCSQDAEPVSPTTPSSAMTDVSVKFSGFDVYVTPDVRDYSVTRSTADEVGVTRIALKIIDSEGNTVFSTNQVKGVDDNFDNIECQLLKGTYKFVAVAHKASDTSSPNAEITSATSASISDKYVPKFLFSKSVDVTISEESTQSVSINFGARITSTLAVKPKDDNLDGVEHVQVVVNPAASAASSPYVFDPTTGFIASHLSYTSNYALSDYQNLSSFVGKKLSTQMLLTSETQTADVIIRLYDSNDQLLNSYTVNSVTLNTHGTTTITGYFLRTNVTNSFEFDMSEEINTEVTM